MSIIVKCYTIFDKKCCAFFFDMLALKVVKVGVLYEREKNKNIGN